MKIMLVLMAMLAGTLTARAAPCGEYEHRRVTGDRFNGALSEILDNHRKWLQKYTEAERDSFQAHEDPRRANLCGAILDGADLMVEDLREAIFHGASLRNVKFGGANLRRVDFSNADLRGADLVGADVTGSYFGFTEVAGLRFEPEPGTLPAPIAIRSARHLGLMTFDVNSDALVDLREEFRKAGRRDLERELTYAIEFRRTRAAFQRGRWVEGAFRFVAWELPTAYDRSPERALIILAVGVALFAIPYFVALSPRRQTRVWVVRPATPNDTTKQFETSARIHGWRRLRRAVFLSVLAALELGWGKFTFARWLSRMQPTESSFRYDGWVRTVTGLQSLVSAYLIAMWFLTYFGRLFQN